MKDRDSYGHKTRFSDSSLYDEKCIYCGARDEIGSMGGLNQRCTATPEFKDAVDAGTERGF